MGRYGVKDRDTLKVVIQGGKSRDRIQVGTAKKGERGCRGCWRPKYRKKYPNCKNIKCMKASFCAFADACKRRSSDCTGFSFEHGAAVGTGCLKKCGTKEFGGFGKDTHDYWVKRDKCKKRQKKATKIGSLGGLVQLSASSSNTASHAKKHLASRRLACKNMDWSTSFSEAGWSSCDGGWGLTALRHGGSGS